MSRELTDKQRKFARLIFEGKTQYAAYKGAGYSVKCGRKGVEAHAKRLLGNGLVTSLIQELRKKAEKASIWDREKMIIFLCGILKINYTDLINPDTGSLVTFEERPDLANLVTGYKVQEQVNKNGDVWGMDKDVKFYSKERAAEQLIKIMGWNAPEKHEHDLSPNLWEWINGRGKEETS